MANLGIHVFGSAHGCPKDILETIEPIRSILRQTVQDAKLKDVGETFHQFEPIGVTGVILLSESHISVHTWPENNMVAIDVFTCGDEGNAELAFDILCKHLKATEIKKEVAKR